MPITKMPSNWRRPKSMLAQIIAKEGQYPDTQAIHASSKARKALKARGGSGQRNPVTGLRGYRSMGNAPGSAGASGSDRGRDGQSGNVGGRGDGGRGGGGSGQSRGLSLDPDLGMTDAEFDQMVADFSSRQVEKARQASLAEALFNKSRDWDQAPVPFGSDLKHPSLAPEKMREYSRNRFVKGITSVPSADEIAVSGLTAAGTGVVPGLINAAVNQVDRGIDEMHRGGYDFSDMFGGSSGPGAPRGERSGSGGGGESIPQIIEPEPVEIIEEETGEQPPWHQGLLPRPNPLQGSNIQEIASNLSQAGRDGDSELVHVTPDEMSWLQQIFGGRGTRNPTTGLLEFSPQREQSYGELERHWPHRSDSAKLLNEIPLDVRQYLMRFRGDTKDEFKEQDNLRKDMDDWGRPEPVPNRTPLMNDPSSIIQGLKGAGRDGDKELAHISPDAAYLLERMGGRGTINPMTGLREFAEGGGGEKQYPYKAFEQPRSDRMAAASPEFGSGRPLEVPFLPQPQQVSSRFSSGPVQGPGTFNPFENTSTAQPAFAGPVHGPTPPWLQPLQVPNAASPFAPQGGTNYGAVSGPVPQWLQPLQVPGTATPFTPSGGVNYGGSFGPNQVGEPIGPYTTGPMPGEPDPFQWVVDYYNQQMGHTSQPGNIDKFRFNWAKALLQNNSRLDPRLQNPPGGWENLLTPDEMARYNETTRGRSTPITSEAALAFARYAGPGAHRAMSGEITQRNPNQDFTSSVNRGSTRGMTIDEQIAAGLVKPTYESERLARSRSQAPRATLSPAMQRIHAETAARARGETPQAAPRSTPPNQMALPDRFYGKSREFYQKYLDEARRQAGSNATEEQARLLADNFLSSRGFEPLRGEWDHHLSNEVRALPETTTGTVAEQTRSSAHRTESQVRSDIDRYGSGVKRGTINIEDVPRGVLEGVGVSSNWFAPYAKLFNEAQSAPESTEIEAAAAPVTTPPEWFSPYADKISNLQQPVAPVQQQPPPWLALLPYLLQQRNVSAPQPVKTPRPTTGLPGQNVQPSFAPQFRAFGGGALGSNFRS